ncbi:putative ABC transport system permease protein [Flavobacterium arsenatis]|uniref:ABC transport system permease protein n=1 Tax=Flavobacterium arsenatis TaxID=1484332 RepID=A0ABU1TL60_9FLAO|nr:FtsX-like permease family protein [Flavobacterium arsenatis]MDR6966665.1 putative ABC transport system permease protein [Flavobacterium arsenatis]
MLRNWFNIFIYQIKNNKLFTALNVLGLSLGMAGLIFAILYWNDEHSYDAWNPEKEKVYLSVTHIGGGVKWASNVAGFEPYFKKDFPEIEAYCFFENWYEKEAIKTQNRKTVATISAVQGNFFSFFPFEFIEGNGRNAVADENSMAISEDVAKALFGDGLALNKQVNYKKKIYVVRGVYRIQGKSSMAPDVVVNDMEKRLKTDLTEWGNFNYGLLLKIKNQSDTASVIKKMERILFENRDLKWAKAEGITLAEWHKKGGRPTAIDLQPLMNARLYSDVDGYPEGQGNKQFLLIMMGISILILILSIVNYINLATANAIKRAKEVGVRKILGASKTNIVLQFLLETAITTIIALLIGLVIVELSLPYYNDFLGKTLKIHTHEFYLELMLILLVIIVLAGIFPALYVSNFETLKVLKGNFSRSKNGIWLRNGMLVFQFAIATFFMVGSYIVYQQIDYFSSKDLGFNGDQIVQIDYRNPYDYEEKDFIKKVANRYAFIKHELGKIDGVKTVSAGSFSFGKMVTASSSFDYNSKVTVQSKNMLIDFGMLDMMKIKIKEGRDISARFSSDTVSSILLNETAVRMMNEKNPIGKKITWNNKELEIVGVIKDFHINGPQEEIPPMTFFHYKTIEWMILNAENIYVKIEPEKMESALAEIETFWIKNVDGDFPFSYDFADKSFARSYQNYVYQRNLFSLLNFVVIGISLFGLFALASYSIQRRMKEIAIRKTLGAETKTLLKELAKQYIVFCFIGFVIALFPVYFLLDKWLENFAYRIDISVIPFVIGFVVLLILTLIVVMSRAYQATQVEVLKYLKYE